MIMSSRQKSSYASREKIAPSELTGLFDGIARLMSLALQYGAPAEKVGNLLAGAQIASCGPVSGHDRLSIGRICRILPGGICWSNSLNERNWRIATPQRDV